MLVLVSAVWTYEEIPWNAQGFGYSRPRWRDSAVARETRDITGLDVFSNGADVIRLVAGRQVGWVPRKYDASTLRENGRYRAEMERLGSLQQRGEAVIVYFRRLDWRKYFPRQDEVERYLDLTNVERLDDGAIYWGPRSSS